MVPSVSPEPDAFTDTPNPLVWVVNDAVGGVLPCGAVTVTWRVVVLVAPSSSVTVRVMV